MNFLIKKMKKLIIYELNELPKRLLYDYIKLRPNSTLASILQEGSFKETITSDYGELHPWSTWPTFYRGVDNSKHGIRFINQDKILQIIIILLFGTFYQEKIFLLNIWLSSILSATQN